MPMIRVLLIIPIVALAGVASCARPVPPVVQTKPPDVTVALPTVRNVTDYEDFTGRTVASNAVTIKARVTGQLMKIHFKDGDRVKVGDPLFDIDPKTYIADYELAKANVAQAEAKSIRSKLEYERQQILKKTNSLSKEEEDRNASERAEAAAAVQVATRQVESAKNYVDYTHIASPIAGVISRRIIDAPNLRMIDAGNLIKADDTPLASIVSTDELFADFDIDDRTLMRLNDLRSKKEIKSAEEGGTIVKIGLPNRDDFSRDGVITFKDVSLNSGTGTILYRAAMPNADKLLNPGLFVRVRVSIGSEKKAVLVPEVAIGTDQGLKYVYVVNEKDEVESRRVKLGLPQDGGLRAVEPLKDEPNSGVRETDRVIVKGLQRVREKAKVTPSFEKPAAAPPGKVGSVSAGG